MNNDVGNSITQEHCEGTAVVCVINATASLFVLHKNWNFTPSLLK